MFDLYLVLQLDCLMSFAPVTRGTCRHKFSGQLPMVAITIEDNIEERAKWLFKVITGLNPTWAKVRFIRFEKDESIIKVYYGTTLSRIDKLIPEYQWIEDKNV